VIVSRYQNAGQNRNLLIANRSFEGVTKFKYLGTTVTVRNKEHIKFGECLLPFPSEYLVYPSRLLKDEE
jgi:hypothetical protein